ncbi:hypothetical protein E2E30_08925 [Sphingomonas sp. AAP5]|uniref:hypothetical protein n=1 Tax=Sphingomonas sp. AAP5 TaxID=1523415 RepID=UPI001057591D|nr:hypothetical protein [Sphingomonas sp. AAP5]QBM75883.1 hypothetical protein E2E30_08925 [Sphingomonas sp. AAP5]
MASNSLLAPVRPANPEERDLAASMTRRAILGGAILAPAIIACATSAVATAPVVSRARWDRLVATFHATDTKMRAIGIEHTVAFERYYAERDKIGERPVAPDRPALKYPKPIEQMTIAEIKATPVEPSAGYAAYEAALASWQAEAEELAAAITGDVDARWEAAVDAQDAAAQAIFAEPIPDTAALLFKINLVEEEYRGCDPSDKVTKLVFEDVRRLMSRGAA